MRSVTPLMCSVMAIAIGCGRRTKTTQDDRDAGARASVGATLDAVVVGAVAAAVDAPPPPPPRDDEVVVSAGGGVPAFYLDRAEVTAGAYAACVKAGACPATDRRAELGDRAAAMGGVNLAQARAFCRWKGKRLPTGPEWMRAAYGDPPRTYPWGEDPATCDHAWLRGCGKDELQPPGRPAGASPFGAIDMVGNAEEWSDPGETLMIRACVTPPPADVEVYGRSLITSPADLPKVGTHSTAGRSYANRDQGIRCARSVTDPPLRAPDPIVAALVGGGGWLVVDRVGSAADAMAQAGMHCAIDEPATPIAGELLGTSGWLVVRSAHATEAEARAAGSQVVAAPARPLARLVGIARCEGAFAAGPAKLTVKAGARRLELAAPESGHYELWLDAGTTARLALTCPPTNCQDPCDAGRGGGEPVTIVLPATGSPGLEASPLDASAGCVCD